MLRGETAVSESDAQNRHRLSAQGRAAGVWWISPLGALALVVPLPLWAAIAVSDTEYRLQWNTPKAVNAVTVTLALAGALVLLIGTLLPQLGVRSRKRGVWPDFDPASLKRLGKASGVLFWLTVTGYVAFALAAVARGLTLSALVSALVTQDNYQSAFREQLAPIPGVTTLTQVGVAYVVVAALELNSHRSRRTTRRLVIVVLLAVVRAFLNTERLALLELAVPLLAIGAVAAYRRGSGAFGRSIPSAPAVLVPLLFLVFAAFEYSRSWQYFSSRTDQGFPRFVLVRLAGYYVTAYNNGELRLEHARFPGRLPFESIQALWDAPVLKQVGLYGRLSAQSPLSATQIFERYGNPEFNNPGGLLVPFVDFGVAGGLVFFLIAGLAIGAAYRGFTESKIMGLLIYPVLLTGLYDIPRYVYWTQGRLLPALVCLVGTAVYVGRARAVLRPTPTRPRPLVLIP